MLLTTKSSWSQIYAHFTIYMSMPRLIQNENGDRTYNPMENLLLLFETTVFSLFIICLVLFDRKLVDLVRCQVDFAKFSSHFRCFSTISRAVPSILTIYLSCDVFYMNFCCWILLQKYRFIPDGFHCHCFRASSYFMGFQLDMFSTWSKMVESMIFLLWIACEIANTSHLAKNITQTLCPLFKHNVIRSILTISCQLIRQIRFCSEN